MDVLTFHVGVHRYAVAVSAVQEILRAVATVALPQAPPVVCGVINLRGHIVPVLDLRVRFGVPRRPIQPDENFIVLRVGSRMVALRVDRAEELLDVAQDQIAHISSVTPHTAYAEGLVALPDGLVFIADLPAFLSEAEAALLDEALDADTVESSR